MPNPIQRPASPAASPPPSPPTPASDAPPRLRPPPPPPLLADAGAFASRAFASHVASVLRQASASCLRRTLARRVEARLRRLPRERLADDGASVEELLADEGDALTVSRADVDDGYRLAARVGNKWAEELRRGGYGELAGIAEGVAREGRFLEDPRTEPAEDAGAARTTEGGGGATGRFATPHAALHALRRRPADCDGSGVPPERLPAVAESDDRSSVRALVRQIDEMAASGRAGWRHGWDAVEAAAVRNRRRMRADNAKVAARPSGEMWGMVPREKRSTNLEDGDEEATGAADARSKSVGKRGRSPAKNSGVRFEGDGEHARVVEEGEPMAKRRRRSQRTAPLSAKGPVDEPYDETTRCFSENNGNRKSVPNESGRPPSSIGDERFSWEEVHQSMTEEERRELVVSSIHPPHPFESDMKNASAGVEDEDAPHNAVVCGALKEVGQVHLWERTRDLPPMEDSDDNAVEDREPEGKEIIQGASEARASEIERRRRLALRKAKRERLGRRTAKGYPYGEEADARAAARGRVVRTEDEDVGRGATGRKEWLEMDLGECTVELVEEDGEAPHAGSDGEGGGRRRFLAFRSLEVALMH